MVELVVFFVVVMVFWGTVDVLPIVDVVFFVVVMVFWIVVEAVVVMVF